MKTGFKGTACYFCGVWCVAEMYVTVATTYAVFACGECVAAVKTNMKKAA